MTPSSSEASSSARSKLAYDDSRVKESAMVEHGHAVVSSRQGVGIEIVAEVLLDEGAGDVEVGRRVLMRAVLALRIVFDPPDHRVFGGWSEIEAEAFIDGANDSDGFGHELAVSDVVERVGTHAADVVHPAHAFSPDRQLTVDDPRGIESAPLLDADEQADQRCHRFEWISVGLDDGCGGEHVEERVDREDVARVLEEPRSVGLVRADEAEVVGVASVARSHVLGEHPLVVGGNARARTPLIAHEGLRHRARDIRRPRAVPRSARP